MYYVTRYMQGEWKYMGIENNWTREKYWAKVYKNKRSAQNALCRFKKKYAINPKDKENFKIIRV